MPPMDSRRSTRPTNGRARRYCGSCGQEASEGFRFCTDCGRSLSETVDLGSGDHDHVTNGHDVASDRIGDVVAGFRLERVVGRGGMGVVFLARQLKFDREVALKLIAPEFTRDVKLRERFKREAMAAATLNSPYVVPVYDAGEADGELYIVMPYVEGADLGAVLAAERVLEPRRAARIVSQLGAALDTAHSHGLVHRDVKPGNVLLSSSGRNEVAYLSDFGLLRRLGEESAHTSNGRWVGTLDYAAPEQIEGRSVDRRADVYALGCVFYRCIAGQAPFRRETPTATMWAHVNEPPPNPREIRPSLPPVFAGIIAKALAKDPAQRFETAGDLGRAAIAAAEGNLEGSTLQLGGASALDLSTSWTGSAAFRPTYQDRGAAPLAGNVADTSEQRSRRWPRKYLIASVAALVLLAGVAAAMALSGAFSGHPNQRLAAIRNTAKKSVALANGTDGLARQLGSLTSKLKENGSSGSRQQMIDRPPPPESGRNSSPSRRRCSAPPTARRAMRRCGRRSRNGAAH